MNTELSQLRCALVVSQHRSIRQAANTLNVRQSTLSRRLRALEHQLGAAIFIRSNGGTMPTAEGQEFLKAARRIISEADTIAMRFRARSRGEIGYLTAGVHASLSTGNFRATLIEYRQHFPGVRMRLTDGSSEQLIADLASSVTDVAFLLEGSPQWDDLSLSIWSERVVVAIPENHPLSRHDVIFWSQLQTEKILIPRQGPGREILNLVVSKIGLSADSQFECHDASLDRLLTLVGIGTGILLALEGATGGSYPGVTFREVHDLTGVTRLGFRAVWRQDNRNPALEPLLDILRERHPDISSKE